MRHAVFSVVSTAATLMASVLGCAQETQRLDSAPTVSISATPTSGIAPLEVQFFSSTSGGNGALSFHWDFGDGSSSETRNPRHVFDSADAVRVVRLAVADEDGDESTASLEIYLVTDDAPSVSATAAPDSGPAPLTVDFDCSVVGGNAPVVTTWSFGEGSTTEYVEPTFTYVHPGVYSAACYAVDANGDWSRDTVTITVDDTAGRPEAVATVASGTCATVGQSVRLDGSASSDPDGAPLHFEWVFVTVPPGADWEGGVVHFDNPNLVSPTFQPKIDGEYQVRLFVSDGANTAASAVLSVTVSTAASIEAISGGLQNGVVAEPLADELVVEVRNGCGAPIDNWPVDWAGQNASPVAARTYTDTTGRTSVGVLLGTVAGPASATAQIEYSGQSEVFELTAVAGPPGMLLMDDASTAIPTSSTPSSLYFRVADRFGNPVTAANVDFDLLIDPPSLPAAPTSALFDDCTSGSKTKANVTTTAGVASVAICNTVAERAYIGISNVSDPDVVAGGTVTLLHDDMEDGTAWSIDDPNPGTPVLWERGAPTYPAWLEPVSPTAVWGTLLDGPIPSESQPVEIRGSIHRSVDLRYPSPVYAVHLTFQHFMDIQGCGGGALFRSCAWCQQLVPEDGYDYTCFGYQGYSGSFPGWQEARFDLTDLAGTERTLWWSVGFLKGDAEGAGWYIDDLEVTARVQTPFVTFANGS